MDEGTSPHYSSGYILVEKNGIKYNCFIRRTSSITNTKRKGYVVLLHGILSSSATMLGLMEYLSLKGYECLAPDLLAHGFTTASVINPSDYRVAYVAEIVHELVTYIGYNNYLLLGHSAGGIVAQVYADMYSREVSALVLSSTSCKLLKTQTWNYGLSREALAVFQSLVTNPIGAGKFGADILTEDCDSSKLDKIRQSGAIIASQANREGISLFIQQNLNIDLRDVLIKTKIRTMILIGDKDGLFSVEEAEWMRDNIQDAYLHIFKGKNHAPQLTDYKRYNRVVYDFLSGELDKCDIFTAIPIPTHDELPSVIPNSLPNNKGRIRPPLVL